MRISTLFAVLLLAAAAIFAYQNESLLYQQQTVLIPGGSVTGPLVGWLVLASVAAIILLWLADVAGASAAAANARRLERRLAERERELVDLKGGAINDVSRKIDDLARRLDERWAVPSTQVVTPAPAVPPAPREPVAR